MTKYMMLAFIFFCGLAAGIYIWNEAGEEIKSKFSRELTPEEEVQRIMDCLGIGD